MIHKVEIFLVRLKFSTKMVLWWVSFWEGLRNGSYLTIAWALTFWTSLLLWFHKNLQQNDTHGLQTVFCYGLHTWLELHRVTFGNTVLSAFSDQLLCPYINILLALWSLKTPQVKALVIYMLLVLRKLFWTLQTIGGGPMTLEAKWQVQARSTEKSIGNIWECFVHALW